MKYNLIPSDNTDNSDKIYIYILPASFESSSYFAAYPEFRVDDILAGKIIIQIFEGCSSNAIEEIETKLKDLLQKKYEKYAERINTFFTVGLGIFILGIINWVIPDPLPLVDELLFTIGGGITAWKAWNDRKIKLPALAEQTYRYGYDNFKPEVETDSILTTIYKSIRCKIDPQEAGDVNKGMDTIEIESLWMTKYLNIQDLVLSGKSDFGDLIRVLESVLFVKKIIKLEKRNQGKKLRQRLLNLRQEVIKKTGISQDVLAVYTEFYRAYVNYQADD